MSLNCTPCNHAGDLLTTILKAYPDRNFKPEYVEKTEKKLRTLHGQCSNPTTCTCGHRVGL